MTNKIRILYDVDTKDIEHVKKAMVKLKDAIAIANSRKVEIPIKVINKNETLWEHFKRILFA